MVKAVVFSDRELDYLLTLLYSRPVSDLLAVLLRERLEDYLFYRRLDDNKEGGGV